MSQRRNKRGRPAKKQKDRANKSIFTKGSTEEQRSMVAEEINKLLKKRKLSIVDRDFIVQAWTRLYTKEYLEKIAREASITCQKSALKKDIAEQLVIKKVKIPFSENEEEEESEESEGNVEDQENPSTKKKKKVTLESLQTLLLENVQKSRDWRANLEARLKSIEAGAAGSEEETPKVLKVPSGNLSNNSKEFRYLNRRFVALWEEREESRGREESHHLVGGLYVSTTLPRKKDNPKS